jgi:hypothetical protein
VASSSRDVVRLRSGAKAWRVAVILGLALGFCAGSLVGDDHWWPFSPWRMYSTSQAVTGVVWSRGFEVQSADEPGEWVPAPLSPGNVGLNRAEVEGRVPQIQADPDRLATLARSHARLRPEQPAWIALRVVRREIVIVDRKPTGEVRSQVLAQWGVR